MKKEVPAVVWLDFDDFVESELRGLTVFSGVLTGDRELAHDVLVDALLSAQRRWDRIGTMDNPSGYVRRVITTTYLTHARRTARRRTEPVAEPPELPVPDHTGQVDRRADLSRLLRALTPQQTAAVTLRYFCDLDDVAIAEYLSCSAVTVRSHISHALRALRATPAAQALRDQPGRFGP